ncbi:uncharacterized protein LOC114265348 [Camellia sinensis]|uniref:uncharacterized protein LOC114265348 n=1 Tax=Camellia sinensis TaxID=4442 RepID=UPI00103605F9|nr:uncharacterized protein LOC114265348 [Camellia sinensis]
MDHLLSVKMESSDTLKAYNARYWETFNEILDYPTNLAITQYKCGLSIGHRLRESLTMNQPTSMGQLMQRINEHIRVEDDAAASTVKANPVVTDKRAAGKVHAVGQEINRLNGRTRDAICDEDYVRFPAKLGDVQKGFNLHIPWRARAPDGGLFAPKATLGEAGRSRGPPQGVVNVIHGIMEPARVCELRGMIKKAEHMREVLSVHLAIKRGKTEKKDVISFSTRDLERIQTPYNGALVFTLHVRHFDVKRILIDQGSSVEIMYYDAFKQLKLRHTDLALATSPLVGFNSQPEWLMGKIILPAKVGSVVKQVEFWVLKVPSTYNLILGRGWLHAMQAIASTYHQVMRLPSAMGEVEEIWSDQVISKQCFMAVNGNRVVKGFVQMIEGPEGQRVLEDVGTRAEEKVVEELVEVRFDIENPSKFFLLGSSLTV